MVTHEDIRSIALSLPETHERSPYGGRPSFRTTSKMFCWIRDDSEALVVWVPSNEDKAALLAAEPTTCFTTEHYDGHPIVLVSLDHVDRGEAIEFIIDSWRLRGPKRLVAEFNADRGD